MIDEESIKRRIQDGDPKVKEEILEFLKPKLYGFGIHMCQDKEDAEDIVQETLLSIFTHLDQFRAESKLSTWAFRIARNICLKKQRTRSGAPRYHEPLSHALHIKEEQKTPEQHFITHELWQQVHEGIRQLKPQYKEIILLRDVEGMNTAEVAEIMDISISAVKTKLHRARKLLREYLEIAPAPQGCPDIRTIFSQHLEGELKEKICISMQGHIEICSYCAMECTKLQQLINICSISTIQPPPELQKKLDAALIHYLKL
jgi:RNA polymerase sigma-70 factor (ECF subfamily)